MWLSKFVLNQASGEKSPACGTRAQSTPKKAVEPITAYQSEQPDYPECFTDVNGSEDLLLVLHND